MILAGNANIFMYGLRVIMGAIDSVVYWLLVHVVNLLSDIARTNIFSDTQIETFSSRIYFIMGTIMFFKMAISIVHYIIDPDKLTDSKSGFASIIKNTIVALVLVVVVPIAFRYAMYAQEAILQDDTIGRLIVGRTGGTQNNVGDTIATNILSGFVHPDEKIVGDECNSLGYSKDCEKKLRDHSSDLADSYKFVDQDARIGEGASATSPYGYTYLLDMATSAETAKDGGNKNYVITYQFILSTLAGGFAVYIFLLFCIDIAVRTVKLAFLRIIAPIPIATYIDEKGKSMFNNWRKACFSTYFDLFVRLAAVQFGIFMITTFVGSLNKHQICSQNFVNGHLIPTEECHQPGIFVEIFIILGVLLFIKELPKMIEQITGIKLDGKFTLNPVKRLQEIPLVGNAASNTTRKVLGGLDAKRNGYTFRSGWDKAKTNDKGMMADMRKSFDTLLPYSAHARKTAIESREKAEEQSALLHAGEKIWNGVEKAKNDAKESGLSGWELQKAQNLAAANALFGDGDLAKGYAEVMNAKDARDKANSLLTKARESLQAGESFNGMSGDKLVDYISELEVNSAKASSAYSAAESQFVKNVNNDSDARKAYEAYNMYNDQQKYKEVSKVDNYAQGYTSSYDGTQKADSQVQSTNNSNKPTSENIILPGDSRYKM